MDKEFDSIIKELANKYGKSEDYILNIVLHQFRFILNEMEKITPRILIHNLGTFSTSSDKLKAYIYNVINMKRRGEISYSKAKVLVTSLLKKRKKLLIYEQRKRKS